MSGRGHKTGIISTYFHTWLLLSVGEGCLKISPAIRHDTTGNPTTVSATEVRQAASAASMQNNSGPCCKALPGVRRSKYNVPNRRLAQESKDVSGDRALRCLQVLLCSALTNLCDVDSSDLSTTVQQPGRPWINRQECRRCKERAQQRLLRQQQEP